MGNYKICAIIKNYFSLLVILKKKLFKTKVKIIHCKVYKISRSKDYDNSTKITQRSIEIHCFKVLFMRSGIFQNRLS